MALIEMDFASGVGTKITTENFSQSTSGAVRTVSTTTDFSVYDHVFVGLSTQPVPGYTSWAVISSVSSNSVNIMIGIETNNGIHSGNYTLTGTIYAFND